MSNQVTLPQAFDLFRRAIEMKPELVRTITGREKPLREGLQKRFPGADIFLTGSYGRSTKIEPIEDVDLFFVWPESFQEIGKIRVTKDQLLEETHSAIRKLFPLQSIRRQTRSIGLIYPQFRLDVVPAFKRTKGGYFIADRGQNTPDWIYTNPRKQLEFTAQIDRTTGQHATPLVKMLKVWNRHHSLGLKSYHLEVMVLRELSAKPASYAEGARHLFERLQHTIKKSCGDPGESGGRLDAYLEGRAQVRERASAEAKQAAARLAEALALASIKRDEDAIRLAYGVFGSPFPRG